MMKKLRYILISIVIIIIIMFAYGVYNLSAYSVYYAHHMPHAKGTNPEMVMAVDNLFWQKEPKNGKLSMTYHTSTPPNTIYVDSLLISISRQGEKYVVYRDLDDASETYSTDSTGRLNSYFGYGATFLIQDRPMTNEEKEKVQGWIDMTMGTILSSQKKPFINLQWLFNAKYQKRFSK